MIWLQEHVGVGSRDSSLIVIETERFTVTGNLEVKMLGFWRKMFCLYVG